MLEFEFTRRVTRWLERFGFSDNPFATWSAEEETSALPFFFVDRPYLYSITGDPARPQTVFALAGKGAGKTATCQMVIYECQRGRLRERVLPVLYNQFGELLARAEGDVGRVTAQHHVAAVVRLALNELANKASLACFEDLQPDERGLLLGLAAGYANPVVQANLRRIVAAESLAIDWMALTPAETMEILVRLVTRLGPSPGHPYQSLYVLVDRVDDTPLGPPAAVPLLKPLVANGSLLSMPGLAFKFFLPTQVGEELQQDLPWRRNRFPAQIIQWDETALHGLLDERLRYYSQNRVSGLEQLCATPIRTTVVARLVQRSEGSPRTLLRLCDGLVRHHVLRTDDVLIGGDDLAAVLVEFEHEREVERELALAPDSLSAEASDTSTPPPRGLFIDAGSHVWVDGQLLAPPPTDLEFRLLEALYQVAPRVVEPGRLIQKIWGYPSENTTGAADEQNLRKLVARLRMRLEGVNAEGDPRFVRNARGRGYWLNLT